MSAPHDKACARTIGPRIPINQHGGGSARCSASNRQDQPNDFCRFTPPSKTLSTSNAISPLAAASASSATRRSRHGELRRLHDPSWDFRTSRRQFRFVCQRPVACTSCAMRWPTCQRRRRRLSPPPSARPSSSATARRRARASGTSPIRYGPGSRNSCRLMDEAEHDVLAYMAFAAQHRIKLHSTNPLEGLNKEVKRQPKSSASSRMRNPSYGSSAPFSWSTTTIGRRKIATCRSRASQSRPKRPPTSSRCRLHPRRPDQ